MTSNCDSSSNTKNHQLVNILQNIGICKITESDQEGENFEVTDITIHSREFLIRLLLGGDSEIKGAGAVFNKYNYSCEQVLQYTFSFLKSFQKNNSDIIQVNVAPFLVKKLPLLIKLYNTDIKRVVFEIRENISCLPTLLKDITAVENQSSGINFSLDDLGAFIENHLKNTKKKDKVNYIGELKNHLQLIFPKITQVKFSVKKYLSLSDEIRQFLEEEIGKNKLTVVFEELGFATEEEINSVKKIYPNCLYQQYKPNHQTLIFNKNAEVISHKNLMS